MNIHADDPRWTAYVLGELSGADLVEVERELEASAEAREIVDEIRMMTVMLKDQLANESRATLQPAQRAAVISAATASEASRSRRWIYGGFAAAAVAAVLMFSIAIPTLLRSRQSALPPIAAVNQPAPAISSQTAQAVQSKPEEEPPVKSLYANPPEPEKERVVKNKVEGVEGVVLPEGQTVTANAKLEVDSVAEKVTVTGQLQQAADVSATSTAKRMTTVPASQPPAGPGNGAGIGGRGGAGYIEREMSAEVRMTAPPAPPILPNRVDRPFNTEAYDRIEDNQFKSAAENPLSTFSIDVDTASYANTRRFIDQNQLPPKDAVRIEELINYFNYDYAPPSGPHPIAVYTDVASAPWKADHRLVRIGIKAREVDMNKRPPSNLVFLIDVSGSMMPPDRLPLLKSALKLLVDKLTENDRVSIAVYAGQSGLVLRPTTGDKKEAIIQALDRLEAGGSTNGASGIQLAYDVAVSNFIRGGINRVVLCTDGDFNVGVTNQGDLTRLIEDRAKSGVFLSVLGFGMGNLKDSTMEKLADKGNGNYAYIDSLNEGRKVLVEEMGGTLMTVAKDVKIQVDFNPAQVNAYRLIGYENRVLQNQDFNDDKKDAGDMGAGQTVTALFEIVPRGVDINLPGVDASKYRQPAAPADGRRTNNSEMLTVRVRYKQPDAADSTRFDVPLVDRGAAFESASVDFRFAASVAEFGMVLRDSPYKGSSSLDHAIATADRSKGGDRNGYRTEFVRLARKARALKD